MLVRTRRPPCPGVGPHQTRPPQRRRCPTDIGPKAETQQIPTAQRVRQDPPSADTRTSSGATESGSRPSCWNHTEEMAGWDDPTHRLDAERLDELFAQLDFQAGRFKPSGTQRVDLLICGGAAMCYQITHRGTGDVDVMFPPLPAWLREAVRVVARRRGVDPGWFNDGVAQTCTYQPPAADRVIFEGEHIKILAPDNEFLLGMKVLAARDADIEDVLWLMHNTGMQDGQDLHAAAFAASVATGSLWDPSERQIAFIRECSLMTGQGTAKKADGALLGASGAEPALHGEPDSLDQVPHGKTHNRPGALRGFAGRLARAVARLGQRPAKNHPAQSTLCGKMVRSTRRRCRLPRGHRGRCRSVMPSDT